MGTRDGLYYSWIQVRLDTGLKMDQTFLLTEQKSGSIPSVKQVPP